MEKPRLRCVNDKVLVTDADTVLHLRKQYHIVGSLEGTHPANPLQNHYFGLPLVLSPEETKFLLEEDAIELEGDHFEWPHSEQEQLQYKLFKDFHSRGFYITRGIKFGGDYLLYPGDPMRYHSSHIVTLMEHKQTMSSQQLITLGRLCTAVKKTRLLSTWDPSTSQFTHVSLNWSGF
ncbi:tRNA-splicing endonuclease subunit [Coemansia sp. RSA 2336]|nr:tRNA-splicing endonuclease subunit [Coemansia sp. RSA 2336]